VHLSVLQVQQRHAARKRPPPPKVGVLRLAAAGPEELQKKLTEFHQLKSNKHMTCLHVSLNRSGTKADLHVKIDVEKLAHGNRVKKAAPSLVRHMQMATARWRHVHRIQAALHIAHTANAHRLSQRLSRRYIAVARSRRTLIACLRRPGYRDAWMATRVLAWTLRQFAARQRAAPRLARAFGGGKSLGAVARRAVDRRRFDKLFALSWQLRRTHTQKAYNKEAMYWRLLPGAGETYARLFRCVRERIRFIVRSGSVRRLRFGGMAVAMQLKMCDASAEAAWQRQRSDSIELLQARLRRFMVQRELRVSRSSVADTLTGMLRRGRWLSAAAADAERQKRVANTLHETLMTASVVTAAAAVLSAAARRTLTLRRGLYIRPTGELQQAGQLVARIREIEAIEAMLDGHVKGNRDRRRGYNASPALKPMANPTRRARKQPRPSGSSPQRGTTKTTLTSSDLQPTPGSLWPGDSLKGNASGGPTSQGVKLMQRIEQRTERTRQRLMQGSPPSRAPYFGR